MASSGLREISDISLKILLENANIGVVIHRWDTSIIYANPTALKLLRLSYNQIIGKDAKDPGWNFIDEGNRKLQVEEYPVNKVKRFHSPLSNEVLGVVDGSLNVSWFLVNAYMEFDEAEQEGFIVVTFNDITQDKFLFSCQTILDNTQDIVIVTEAENVEYPLGPKIVYVNKAFEKLTEYTAEEVIGETPRILQGQDTSKETRRKISVALGNIEPVTATIRNYSKSGRPYWLEMHIMPLRNRHGKVTHFAAIERDVTEQIYRAEQLERRNADLKELKKNLERIVGERTDQLRRANQELERMAYYDALTGIPNRQAFYGQINRLISLAKRRNLSIVVGIIDIDFFKQLNDRFGHPFGDQVLKEVGAVLVRFFRQEDVYGRVGGEEFAFAMLLEDAKDGLIIANRLLENIRKMQLQEIPTDDGVVVGTPDLKLTASIGLYQSNEIKNLPEIDRLIKLADKALYLAKEGGRDQVKVLE